MLTNTTRARRVKGTVQTSFCCLFSSCSLSISNKMIVVLRTVFDIQEAKAREYFLFIYKGNCAHVHVKTVWSSLNT